MKVFTARVVVCEYDEYAVVVIAENYDDAYNQLKDKYAEMNEHDSTADLHINSLFEVKFDKPIVHQIMVVNH